MPLEKIRVAVKSDDIVLRDPKTMERITTNGKMVVKNSFWIRRLKAGDCVQLPSSETIKPLNGEGIETNGNSVQ